MLLDPFRLGNRRAQSHRQIVREVVAANRYGTGMADYSATVHDQFRGAAANIQQAAAEFPLILGQAGFRGSQWLQHRVVD